MHDQIKLLPNKMEMFMHTGNTRKKNPAKWTRDLKVISTWSAVTNQLREKPNFGKVMSAH